MINDLTNIRSKDLELVRVAGKYAWVSSYGMAHRRLWENAKDNQDLKDTHPKRIPAPFTVGGQRLCPNCAGRAKGNPLSTQDTYTCLRTLPTGSDCYAVWYVIVISGSGPQSRVGRHAHRLTNPSPKRVVIVTQTGTCRWSAGIPGT